MVMGHFILEKMNIFFKNNLYFLACQKYTMKHIFKDYKFG